MSDFDLGGMGALMGGLQQKMQEIKDNARGEGTAGGGLVKVVVSGDLQVQSVAIGAGAMEDRELLEDLIRAATNDALAAVQREIAQALSGLMGGLPLPPGMSF
jgi:DNA-binding YbaB/EbfC family protein